MIPARGGSKGIPQKNIVQLMGRPLLAYTCEAALASHLLDRVVVSTDDPGIAQIARECRVEAPFMRPQELAQDDTATLPVIQHAVRWLQETEGYSPDAVMILQPTSPLRRTEHIDGASEVMANTGADTVVSVLQVPHQYNPVSLMALNEEGWLIPHQPGPMLLRRQDKPLVYARNGPAVLLVKQSTLMVHDTLYGANTKPYLMDEIDSFDVDTKDDLIIIEALLKNRHL